MLGNYITLDWHVELLIRIIYNDSLKQHMKIFNGKIGDNHFVVY